MSTATAHPHAEYCMPRPGADGPRIESWRAPKTGPDGAPTGSVQVVRCVECGEATYDGVRRG